MSQVNIESPVAHPIRGVVAQILNERELVINVGAAHGVKAGTTFAVLAQAPLEIMDPVSNGVLGVIDREKVRVKAIDVLERITICRTYRTFRTEGSPGSAFQSYFARFDKRIAPVDVPETLRAADSSLPKPLSPEDSYVQIKDRVVEVTE